MRIHRGAALALICCSAAVSQEAVDWPALVEKAHHHKRYAMRRAVANKIAQAGVAAIPALHAFAEEHGNNAIGVLVVEAIASTDTTDQAVLALLESWATDRDFYWRAQALRGLADRGMERHQPLFHDAMDDPSHLMRIQGYRGALATGTSRHLPDYLAGGAQADSDPRARIRLAGALALAGERWFEDSLPALVLGLRYRDCAVVDDPWGAREAQFIVKVFKKLAGADAIAETFGWQTDAELRAICTWASSASGSVIERPVALEEPGGLTSAIEFRSCRNGDLFLRWNSEAIYFGLDSPEPIPIPDGIELQPPPHPGTNGTVVGKVICDYLRVETPKTSLKAAPTALPPEFAKWIESVAAALEPTEDRIASEALRNRLSQFVGPIPRSGTGDR